MLPIPFDNPDTYDHHYGVDFGQPLGAIFRASGPGVVTHHSHRPRSGYTVWVRYDVGIVVGYAHMDSHAGCPPIGTRVTEGTPLGRVGDSGNSSGPHLHMEVEGHETTAGFWRFFTPDRVVGQASPSQKPSTPTTTPTTTEEEEEMIIIVQRKNAQLAKGRLLANGRIREITRAENNVYRAAEKQGAAKYVTVSDADYQSLLKGTK